MACVEALPGFPYDALARYTGIVSACNTAQILEHPTNTRDYLKHPGRWLHMQEYKLEMRYLHVST